MDVKSFACYKKRYLSLTFLFVLFLSKSISCLSQELPIKPARTISFTTDEGSYMNVDVSPDGKTLVFDLLGDLYTIPVGGGNATQLTRGIALHLRPVWSPNGKRIAYISDHSGAFHLNVMDLTGKYHRVLGSSDPEVEYGSDALWTPDGNYINIAVSIYGIAGGKISTGINVKNLIRFSPNGQLLYGLDSNRLFIYNKENKSRTLISPNLGHYWSAALSPDARWWAYITDSNAKRCLIVQDLKNGTGSMLVPSLFQEDPRYNPFVPSPHFSFSSDSKGIFIGYGGKIHRINVETGDNEIIPFTAKVKIGAGAFDYNTFRVKQDSVRVKYSRSVHASPDGKRLVFSALDRIYVMDLPNGRPRILAPQTIAQFQPVYSPDGKWLTYVSWCDTIGGSLWRVPAAGGEPQELTHAPGHYQRPAWSPDGKVIAVVRGAPILGDRDDPGIGELELIPVNGGQVKIIDDSIPLWNQLAFSPDGRRIIYTPKPKPGRDPLIPQLVSKDLCGNDLKTEAIGAYFTYLRQKAVSPDGRYIVYSADEDLYLVPVCKLTEPAVISDVSGQFPAIRFAEGVDPYWEKGGKVLAWSYGNKFYRVDPDKIIATAEMAKNKKENDFITATVIPDEVITMNVTIPQNHAKGMIALRNVRIITMQGGKVIEHGTIIMKDGRFTAVGPAALTQIPEGMKVLDLKGATVMPGLVDLHLHMRIPPDVFPQQSWMYLANLAYGVTTARDPSLNFDSFGYAELLESGQMTGPRLFTVGQAVGHGVMRLERIEEVRAVVSKRAELGGVVVKNYLPTSPRIARQWLLIACRQAMLNMTSEGWGDPILQFGMIKDGSSGVEHNPCWGDVYKDVTSLYAKSGIYFTPTLQVSNGAEMGKEYFKYKYWHQPDEKLRRFTLSDPKMGPTINGAESWEQIAKANPQDTVEPNFITRALIDARIRKQGGRVTLGSHGNDEGIGAHNELWALQMGGLSNLEALQAATIMGAEGLGVQKDIGSIEVGKIADLIVLNKNPLEDIHNSREIRYVMKDGILYDGDTLDTIWPIFKKCPEWRPSSKTLVKCF